MPIPLQLQRGYSLGGVNHEESRTINGDTAIGTEISLSAAKAGTLTTRTDDNTGVVTLSVDHGVTDGQKLDVYWSGGSRRGMTVGTVVDQVVPIDGGAGDNLPALSSAITAMVPVVNDLELIGDNLVALIGSGSAKGIISIQETDGTERHVLQVYGANRIAGGSWLEEDGDTNPLAGQATEKVAFSHGDSSGTKTMRLSGMY